MQIRQIQIAQDAVQDRLILRVSTTDNEEFRVWLTRRFLRELWPLLSRMLSGHLSPDNEADDEFEDDEDGEETNVRRTDGVDQEGETPLFFSPTFHEDNPAYPLGAAPILASEAVLEAVSAGIAKLSLREGRERSFHLDLNTDLLQSLCGMLNAGAERAGWDLALDFQQPPANKIPPVKTIHHTSRQLH